MEQMRHLQYPGTVLSASTFGLNSDLASMGLLAGGTESDLLLRFSSETEVVGSSLEEMESREGRFFFFSPFSWSLGPSSSPRIFSTKERKALTVLVLDLDGFLSSEEEDDEESLDFRFDFLREDFFLWYFLLARSDLTDLWLLSLSLSLSERLLSSLLISRLLAVRLLRPE